MIYSILIGLPVIGDVLRIFNAYAYRGDIRADSGFANIFLWLSAFWIEIGISIVATMLCMPDRLNGWLPTGICLSYRVDFSPGEISISVLPNLLGFGIGAYALIFGMNKGILQDLQGSYSVKKENKKSDVGSALILNADMAVPLLIIALTIAVGVAQKVVPNQKFIMGISWFLFWMSMVYTVELICTLFGLGENAILEKLNDKS